MNVSIRLGHTDSVNSVNRQNFLDVELKNTSKIQHFTNVKETIDQYEQFKEEREDCNKYRLILTINPYCTNVLFNTFTEMVYAEGSDECDAVLPDGNTANKVINTNVMGVTQPDSIQMVMNTEYSRPGIATSISDNDENYIYHPGYDIFDNHILRNQSFKIVNKLDKGNDAERKIFNTIADRQRTPDGNVVKYKRRESINDNANKENTRHLYDFDDILQFGNGDAVNANLVEENGWYGFINTSAIQARKKDTNGFNELNIGRVLNDHKSCEFIDMYPDRTLYSFNPKYNKYRHRLEYNWDIILTYPSYSSDDYHVVSDGECNGLVILDATRTTGPSGDNVILFRCLTKHGLKRGDKVRFYYREMKDREWKQIEKNFIVRNIGNLNNEEKEYYFYINDMDFIRKLSDTGEFDDIDDDKLEVDKSYDYRFARIVGNTVSKYYVRIFKKLPNFKYKHENFPPDDSMTMKEYIENNAKINGKMVLFDKEQYKPAFETTIYTDDTTQITFTDTIDVSYLKDDLGRPLSEIYVTIVKSNRGNEKWYNNKKYNDGDVEFSHCFGNVSCGLKFSQKNGDMSNTDVIGTNEDIRNVGDFRQSYGDITMIYKDSSPYGNNITADNDEFLGDIVEFNDNECTEKIIQPFLHRFNTAQRELGMGNNVTYHEIWSDDWDKTPDDTNNLFNGVDGFFSIKTYHGTDAQATWRPEGYYYQPHYRIPIREFGVINQGQHYDINVRKVTPVQFDGIFLKVDCIRNANVSVGDTIYLFNDETGKSYEFVVTYLVNKGSFCIAPRVNADYKGNVWKKFYNETNLNWIEVAKNIMMDTDDEKYWCLRRKNSDIPDYAVKVGKNKYLWRDALKPGNMDIQNLPEYAYGNDAFYITNEINFFLRRQDPQGWNGLYCKNGFPNDIYGNIRKESNYVYKEESEVTC